jgi:hypothetical protein
VRRSLSFGMSEAQAWLGSKLGWARGRKLWCCLLIRDGQHNTKLLRIQGLSLFRLPNLCTEGNSFPGGGFLVTESLGWSPTPASAAVRTIGLF